MPGVKKVFVSNSKTKKSTHLFTFGGLLEGGRQEKKLKRLLFYGPFLFLVKYRLMLIPCWCWIQGECKSIKKKKTLILRCKSSHMCKLMRAKGYKSSLHKVWSSVRACLRFHISMALRADGGRTVWNSVFNAVSIGHGARDERTHWHNCLPCGSPLHWMLASSQSFHSLFLFFRAFLLYFLALCWFIELTVPKKKKLFLAFDVMVCSVAPSWWILTSGSSWCSYIPDITQKTQWVTLGVCPCYIPGHRKQIKSDEDTSTPCALITWKRHSHN